ncbi:DUF3150 domain-containing protein [Eoetvoesiella caeni]
MSEVHHFDSLSVILADFDVWSGQTRLSAQDFKLGVGGEIPPEKLAQLGSKKICDPANLKGFHRLKTESRRLLLRYGMPFMNGYAVPVSKTTEICEKLDLISTEFQTLKDSFINGYNTAIEEWIRENPEYESMIRSGALPLEEVKKRIGFEYQVFMIQPLEDNEANTGRLNRKVESLGSDLITEVNETAQAFYNERFIGKDRARLTTKLTLVNLRNKIDGLSFLNGSLVPLVGLLDETIQGYSQHSVGHYIEAPFFYQVMAVVSLLSRREYIEQFANGQMKLEALAHDLNAQASPGLGVGRHAADAIAHEHRMKASSDDDYGTSTKCASYSPVVSHMSDPETSDAVLTDILPATDFSDIERFFQQHAGKSETAMTQPSAGLDIPAPNQGSVHSTPQQSFSVDPASMPMPSLEEPDSYYFG